MVYVERSDQAIGYVSPGVNYQPVLENLSCNAGHYAVGFDLTGESNEGDHPALFETHLVMVKPKQSKETKFFAQEKVTKSTKLIHCIKVGNVSEKFGSLCGKSSTLTKEIELLGYYNNLFSEKFVKEFCKGDINWGKLNNCHNFAKLCIKDLGLQWPEAVVSPLENYPFLTSIWSAYQDAEISTNQTS